MQLPPPAIRAVADLPGDTAAGDEVGLRSPAVHLDTARPIWPPAQLTGQALPSALPQVGSWVFVSACVYQPIPQRQGGGGYIRLEFIWPARGLVTHYNWPPGAYRGLRTFIDCGRPPRPGNAAGDEWIPPPRRAAPARFEP